MDAQIQDALAKVAEAQKALAEAQAAALAQAAGVAPAAVQTPNRLFRSLLLRGLPN
ncbi:MAG: hypothetical protein ACLRPT_00440 [Akkermansia muciniphila]